MSNETTTIPSVFVGMANQHGSAVAQWSKDASGHFVPTTYQTLLDEVGQAAQALAVLGVKAGQPVGLISENRKEWLIADLAVLGLGACDVPRGNDVTALEVAYILGSTECRVSFVEGLAQAKLLLSVIDRLPKLETIVMLDPEAGGEDGPALETCHELLTWRDFLAKAKKLPAGEPADPAEFYRAKLQTGQKDDTATIIFTSGTTGEPKGVMLTHNNFLHQVRNVPKCIQVSDKDIWLCVLPVWHSFERVMQYISIGQGSALAYSKPLGKILLADLKAIRPTWMASVPRIWAAVMDGVRKAVKERPLVARGLFAFFVAVGQAWCAARNLVLGRIPRFQKRWRPLDTAMGLVPWIVLFPLKLLGDLLVFKGIRERLGGRFVAGISGGGALPPDVDKFFEAAGILLLEGYGITETAPVLAVRYQNRPVPGTVGPVFPGTEIKIVDEQGQSLPPGHKGLILARGPQVMKGYFNKPEWTAKAISPDGWFNTGDLGMLTWDNEIKIVGRAKDTIVLLGGENIEPQPIEQKLLESPYIETAVVVGQDQKYLGALILPKPEYLGNEDLIKKEVARLISSAYGFKAFERVVKVALLEKPFQIGQELSAKQEIKRHRIAELYAKEIAGLFKNA